MTDARKEKDLQAWNQWNRSHADTDLMAVMSLLEPVIRSEVGRWSGSVAPAILSLEARRLAVDAIKGFNPNAGAALNTHVTNQLKKLSRTVYDNQNVARIPEYKVLQVHNFNLAESKLRDNLGRDPTADELLDELGWTKKYLADFQRSRRKEFIESGELPRIFDLDSGDGGLVDFAYHDLSPLQQKIFEFKTGYGGNPVLSGSEIMKKLKLKQSQLSYQQRKMTEHFTKVMQGEAPK